MRRLALLAFALALAACNRPVLWPQKDAAAAPPKVAPKFDDEGYQVLLGDSAEGWMQAGPGGFDVKDAVATARGGMGLWYYAAQSFQNYILTLQFKQPEIRSNSGVFVRFPRVEGDPWNPVHEGYEIQVYGDRPNMHHTGAVYSFQAATSVPVKPPGEWNDYEIVVVGPWIHVTLNGVHVNSYKGDRSLRGGMIGVQNHDNDDSGKSAVAFRNIRIREFPKNATGYHVLFNGKDLQGWKLSGDGGFEAVDGTLRTTGDDGYIWHDLAVRDYVLHLEWKTDAPGANSGVFLRLDEPGVDGGLAVESTYEVQIRDDGPDGERTGSIFGVKDATSLPVREAGGWNTMEIRCEGQDVTVRINGRQVNRFTGDRSTAGHVGLKGHANGTVTFRNIRLVTVKPKK